MADYTYITPYTYNGVQYKRGDAVVVTGNYYYSINDTSANGSVSNATKYFYGYAQMNDGSSVLHPLGLMNSASHSSVTFAQMDMSAIKSGGTPLQYKITINMNGGTATNNHTSMTVVVGTNSWYAFGGLQPTRTGYTFKGLYTSASGGEQVYNASGLAVNGTYWSVSNGTYSWKYAGNVTLYAQWTANTYYIKYNGNGATSGSMSNSTHRYGTAYNLTANAYSRTGYTFIGWAKSSSGSVAYSNKASFNNMSSTNGATVNLYAVWQINTYTNSISHWTWGYKNGEGNNSGNTAFHLGDTTFTATYNSQFVMDSSRAKTVPNGFYLGSAFGTSYISGSWTGYTFPYTVTQKASAGSFEYDYDPISYGITYNMNGGTNNSSNPSTYNVLYGVTFKNPSRVGYSFTGWNKEIVNEKQLTVWVDNATNSSGTITFTNNTSGNTFNASKVQIWSVDGATHIGQIASLSTSSTGKVSQTFTFTAGNTGVYKIKLGANGSTKDAGIFSHNVELIKGKDYTVSYNQTSASSSKIVISDFSLIELKSTGINEGDNATFSSATDLYNKLNARHTGDITLIANWLKSDCTATYNPNGGSVSPTSQGFNTGEIISNMPIPTKSGCKHLRWYTQFNGSNFLNLGRDYMYEDKISIHFEAYSEDWTEVGRSQHMISCTEGGGWNIESYNGYIVYAMYDKGVGYKTTTSSTLYSSLSKGWHTFDMVFDGSKMYGYLDGNLLVTSATFSSGKIGYNSTNSIFVGAEAGSDGQSPVEYYFKGRIANLVIKNQGTRITDANNVFIAPYSNVTFYAEWETGYNTLTINPNGGTWNNISTNQSFVQKDGTTKTIANPTREHYTFDGWSLSGGGSLSGTTYTYGAFNGTLTAKWTPVSFPISYNLNGGTFLIPNPSSYTIEDEFTLNNPIREGYKFVGWTDSNGDDLNTSTTIYKGTVDELSYVANWVELTSDERKIYVHQDGTLEATMFVESDKFGLYNTGTVYAKEFVEGSNEFKITSDGKIHCKQLIEYNGGERYVSYRYLSVDDEDSMLVDEDGSMFNIG